MTDIPTMETLVTVESLQPALDDGLIIIFGRALERKAG
jgi:hypothetical protein